MKIRLEGPFCPGVRRVRAGLAPREQKLFDLLCAAGQLGYRLPDGDINLRHASGAKDPRLRLAREFPWLGSGHRADAAAWTKAGHRLFHILADELAAPAVDEQRRALRVLLAYATIALAPDCVVPRHPASRAAWRSAVKLFTRLFPSEVEEIGELECVRRRLTTLRREAAAGLKIGRVASGKRPGPAGRALAVDPQLITQVGRALGKKFTPGYMARYLFYTKPGDHIWPHPDDPQWAVTVLVCILHDLPPGESNGSAFLAYSPRGSSKRYPLAPGSALAVEPGLIHAREPVRKGERVVLLSIGLR